MDFGLALRAWISPRTGLLIGSLFAVLVLDLFGVRRADWSALITFTQTVLCVGWLVAVLRIDTSDTKGHIPTLRDRRRQSFWHLGTAALLAFLLFEKWTLTWRRSAPSERDVHTYELLSVVVTLLCLAGLIGRGHRLARFFAGLAEHPARFMALTFLLLSLFGSVLLATPIALRADATLSFLDAWFMATSAVCVTGLALHPIASTYSFFGQAMLLMLVQVGGLGIMVLSAAFTVLSGRKMRTKSRAALAEVLDADSLASLRYTIRRIAGFTFGLELLGALLLYLSFRAYPEVALPHGSDHVLAGSGSRVWAAIYYAVCAFCNAGFSLAQDSIVGFASSPFVCSVIMALIVLGGIGFPVLSETFDHVRYLAVRKRPPRFSLHARTVVVVSLGLIVSVAFVLGVMEWNGPAFAQLSTGDRVMAALFQSITTRSAGYTTVNISQFGPAALFLFCLIMFIGASPGGTGGGLKTTTFAVFYAVFRAELKGGQPYFLDRRLSSTTVSRAVSTAFISSVVLTVVVLGLFLSEKHPPLALVFEAVSAFATVGLSTGITPELSPWGKLIIIFTMLIGRIGPLTFALAAARRGPTRAAQLPESRLMIG